MKPIIGLILFFLILILLGCNSKEEKKLELTGKVIGAETDTIYLIKIHQDMRHDSLIKIPVNNENFSYSKKLKNSEVVFVGLMESLSTGIIPNTPLFLENEKIQLTIYPEADFGDRYLIQGGKLNDEYRAFQKDLEAKFNHQIIPLRDSLSLLAKSNNYYNEKAQKLYDELRNSKNHDEKRPIYKKLEGLEKNNQLLSPKAKELNNRLTSIYEKQKQTQQSYIDEKPSLVSYYFFIENLKSERDNIDVNLAKRNYQILSQANPNHPYNELSSNMINAIEKVKVGKKYIDFTAPDLNGNEIKLSDKISGRIALLDLWATWCGPCIAKSRTMIPLYNEYNNKGFNIVGVAGEFKNTDRLEKFLQKEKWPWIQLVELDRQNRIWEKYGVDGAGGALFLIGKGGKIIAKDPTAQEVRQVLENRLVDKN